jgi:hypothetical protein
MRCIRAEPALAGWQNTAHLGPTAVEEATARAQLDPRAPFVAEEMAALGLEVEQQAMGRQGGIDCRGVTAEWRAVGAELNRAAGDTAVSRGELAALAMDRVGPLAGQL